MCCAGGVVEADVAVAVGTFPISARPAPFIETAASERQAAVAEETAGTLPNPEVVAVAAGAATAPP